MKFSYLHFCLLLTIIAACTAEIINVPQDNRYFYFVGDDETELTPIDEHEPADEGFIARYAQNPDNNGYWLYTRSNPVSPQILRYKDTESLKHSNFNKDLMTVFLVHGWRGNSLTKANTMLTEAFLQHQDLNVIVFDWSVPAGRNYLTAKMAVPALGRTLGQFIEWLVKHGVSLERTHLVGYSLGGQLVGSTGRYLDGRVRRITALDPAGPFWTIDGSERLNFTDAQYVEVIHTNTFLLGYMKPLGDADFYPNGGLIQPGCAIIPCSHARSYEYMAASIMYNHIRAHKCDSMYDLYSDQCNGAIELMGNSELRPKTPGIYRVNLEKSWPFEVSNRTFKLL